MGRRLPGYVPEEHRGATRHRVRVEGERHKRITIPVGPTHPDFFEHYYAARSGRTIKASAGALAAQRSERSVRTLFDAYLDWLLVQAKAGSADPKTHVQRKSLLGRVCDMRGPDGRTAIGEYDRDLPAKAMIHIQDGWGARTAQADNSMKAIRAAYKWAIPRGKAITNPAVGIAKVHRSKGGAVPWSLADAKAFLARHPSGTPARMWLMLSLWTTARLVGPRRPRPRP